MLAPSSLKRAIRTRTSTRLKEPATELVPALKHCPANLSAQPITALNGR